MVKFIYFVSGLVWDTLADITYEDWGIEYRDKMATWRIPWSSILYIQVGMSKE